MHAVPADSNCSTTPTPLVQGKVAYDVAAIEGLGMSDAVADRDALDALDVVDQVNTQQSALLHDAIRELKRARKARMLARTTPSNRAQFERDAEGLETVVLGLLLRAVVAGETEHSPLRYASERVSTSREQALAVVADCEHLLTGARP